MMVMAQRQIPTKHVCQLAAIITNTMALIMAAIITNTITLLMAAITTNSVGNTMALIKTTWNVFSKGILGTGS